MNQKTPKYFHYFIACVIFDSLVLFGLHTFFCTALQFLIILACWILANFLNYPRIASRRYISYYKLLGLTFRQFIAYFVLYGALFILLNDTHYIPTLPQSMFILSVIGSRLIFVFVLRFYRIKGKGYNRFLLIGKTPAMDQLAKQFLAKKSYGHILEAQFATFNPTEVEAVILNRNLNEIYCSSQNVTQNDLSELLAYSFQYGVNVHVVSDNQSDEKTEEDTEEIQLEYSEIELVNYPLMDQKNLLIKRAFDLLFSSLVILTILSWLIPLMAIIILIDSRGPIFFKQPRAGRNGKYFMCLKLRSMVADAGNKQATKNDPRITRVGRIIRKLSIDEFPQFINVFRGQMSVVGPRPHVKELNDKYDARINNYTDRILVKPGITGLSQITGHRGETNGTTSMANRIRIDILYLRSWTLLLDIVIIYKTVIDVLFFKSKNAY